MGQNVLFSDGAALPRSRRMLRRSPHPLPIRAVLAICCLVPLAGCGTVVMDPAGDVARQEAHLIWWATGLMMVIILPVLAMTGLFAWRYRASNQDATYTPDWDHSTGLELVIWAAPLMIVIALGALTWVGTHTLDPYRPLARTAPGRPVASGVRPLEIEVVSLDWKWLFIYPEQGVATINRLVVPVDRPVRFRMTSSSVMNTLWIPSMAGMIYTMPGMETTLHGVLNRAGRFDGHSGHYSGAGFSGMTFSTFALPAAGFARWADRVRARSGRLDAATYLRLEKPSYDVPPMAIGSIDRGLFSRIVMMCVHPGAACMGDAMPGMGAPGMNGVAPAVNDRPLPPSSGKGALTRPDRDKGEGPASTVPHGDAPGAAKPGSPANRNMTMLDRPRLPGARVEGRA